MAILTRIFRYPLPLLARSSLLRFHSTSGRLGLASSAYVEQQSSSPATHETPSDLTRPEREALAAALRVDQAGEVAANYIYMGQMAVLGKDPKVGGLIQVLLLRYAPELTDPKHAFRLIGQSMWNQEKRHLSVMNALQAQHRVQPTALHNVAQVAGWGLGAVTALMGKEAAMACTEAVETVIGEHYDE
jgi:ubiquinone biosynthesis monooxygenase Coq7